LYERPQRARVLFAVLLLAAVTVISLDFREQSGGPVDRLQRTAISIFGPLQQGVSAVLRPIGGLFSGIWDLRDIRRDNRKLTGEVERLRLQERTYADLLSENRGLRKALGMAQRCGCRTVGAKVVGRSGSNFQRSVTIDAGARQGVTVDMAVINGAGLVGRVVQVGDGYANVLLLVDPSSGVAATLGNSRAPGLLKGRGDRQLELELLQPDAKVQLGEPVLTQGYREGVFPPGLPIGVVTKVPPASDLVRRIAVQPFASADSLDLVAVVIDRPASPNTPPVMSPDIPDGPTAEPTPAPAPAATPGPGAIPMPGATPSPGATPGPFPAGSPGGARGEFIRPDPRATPSPGERGGRRP
jgi:rod shape-determining protein MreC